MNSELKRLIDLQQLDLQIVEFQKRTDKIPDQIKSLDQILEENRQALEQAHQRAEDAQKLHRTLEADVESLHEKLSRYKTQLMEVKTNKEYQSMLVEIENAEKEIEVKEDQILETMMAIDEHEVEARKSREELEKKEKETVQRRDELQGFVSEAETQIVSLRQAKEQLETELSSQLTEQYQKIASVRNGLALAEARDESCQACHVRLRPQLFNEIKTNLEIITCENCNRILYYAGI